MRHKRINIKYWTYTDGSDFSNFNEFVEKIDHSYFLSINRKRSDSAGGGIYDIVIKISENISIVELANSYLEDGIKVIIGYFLRSLFKPLKSLFNSNRAKNPGIDKIILDFKDCKIVLHEIYPNGIEDNFEDIMKKLFEFTLNNKKLFSKSKSIQIPIFKHRDSYDLCNYRVKLEIDEPITKFQKEDYTNYWGIKSKKKAQIYCVKEKQIVNEKFYTQKGYNKLLKDRWNNAIL